MASQNVTLMFQSFVFYGGASYNFERSILNPQTGYMIPIEGKGETHPAPQSAEELHTIVLEYIKKQHSYVFATDKEIYLGIWLNPDNVTLHIDVAQRIENEAQALRIAREYGAIAIYNNATGQVISVKYAHFQSRFNPSHIQSVTTV